MWFLVSYGHLNITGVLDATLSAVTVISFMGCGIHCCPVSFLDFMIISCDHDVTFS